MKCFYHSSDLDGKCSAAVVKRAHPKAELVPINYGWPFPWSEIREGDTVVVVDFCLQPFSDMLMLQEQTRGNVIWVDHHIKHIEFAQQAERELGVKFDGIQRDGIGACLLAWEMFFPQQPVPLAVRLLAEYDVWKHDDPMTLPFQYGMRSIDHEPDNNIWNRLIDNEKLVHHLVGDGKVILRYIGKDNAIKCRTLWFTTELDGLTLCAANHGPSNSQFFDVAWDRDKFDAMCLFYWSPKKRKWAVSLYTDKPGVDVGQVAVERGGGGHLGAAGFQCKELPFALNGHGG